MGRIYSVIMDAVAVVGAQDLIRITAPSDAILRIHEVTVSQESVVVSDQGAIQLMRASTAGTGSGYTAKLLELGDAAFGGSAVVDLSVDTTPGDILRREGFNVLPGYKHIPPPNDQIIIPPSGIFVVRSDVPITSAVLTCEVIFEEEG